MTSQTLSKDKFHIPIILLICCVGAIFLGLTVSTILKNKNSYLNESRIKAAAQAQLLGKNAASLIYDVDLTLMSIRSIVEYPSCDTGTYPVSMDHLIQSQLMSLPQIDHIVYLNANQDMQYSSTKQKTFELKSFEEHRDAWVDFSINVIFNNNLESKILISRRVEKRNGDFMGVLAAVVDPVYFFKQYEDWLNINVDAIALFDMNGNIISSWFNRTDISRNVMGSNIRTIPLFSSVNQDMRAGGGRRTHEDANAIVATFQLSGFPFQIAVSYSKQNILDKWFRETKQDIAIIAITLVITLFTITLGFQQRKQRKQAELEIARYHAGLEETVEKRTRQLSETNKELLEINEDLKKAMAEIKTLSGMLPICSYCKKIRDDQGYWGQIESYIRKHSEAEFSHGICPECARKFFPDMNLYGDDGEKIKGGG